ncbi:carbohydrate-binding protein [Streptomyces sp. SID8379]|uniref:carbohydrate-binding protein n=1 Tax=unclassified Streptomyces TaxID=2593676 RepID=UPI0003629F92|nr:MULTISPECIES: carbohydrate-binding protein [unclassified Streptomyces]MYW67936.1 carbohydrate-binding protein [Streptomyces sp. SID8379]
MAPGNNGASTTPEDDDPFGYLYADGQAAGATPPDGGGGGYGYPNPRSSRSSYHQVRTVGERQYGQQQVPPQQQTAAYHQPNAHYQAPETMPGGGAPTQPGAPQPRRGGGGRGPNTKALLIGAVAVVAAVIIGIGIAMLSNGSDDDSKGDEAGGKPSGDSQSVRPSETASPSASADPVDLPKTDAKSLTLAGGTSVASDVKGADAAGGQYVAGFNKVGASLTWTVNDIPKDASYSLRVKYGVPGKDADATVSVNGTKQTRPLNMTNFAHAKEGDWEHGWTNTYAVVQLTKGTNAITVSCEQGNKCDANFDQMWLVEGTNG